MKISQLLISVFVGMAVVTSGAFAYEQLGKPTGFVNDYTGTLSEKTKTDLEALLTSFRASGKGEVSVVMIGSLKGDSIENYALELGREWGVGAKGKDNGALLLIAKDDRELRIEVGYGLEGDLTDAKSSRIIRDVITPRFKEGNYDAGVANGVREILGVIDPTFAGATQTIDYTTPSATNSGSIDIGWIFALFPIALVWIVSMLARSKSWYAGGIIGGVLGIVVSLFIGLFYGGIIAIVFLTLLGLVFDYAISKGYRESTASGTRPPWWTGGGGSFGGRSSGGGFGGFGGGSFGGGGASGKW